MRRCPQGMPMAENPENKQRWYALRVTYGREMLVKGYLDGIGVESYIPMHFARRTYGERTRKVWEPLIHNLLFICTSAVRLKEIKACTTLPIRYIMDREIVRAALRTAKEADATDQEWQEFIDRITQRAKKSKEGGEIDA